MFCVPLRKQIGEMLGIPEQDCPLCARQTGQNLFDGVRIEKWIYQSEPGSWVTALLYLPECGCRRVPAVILTNGHGESKALYATPIPGSFMPKRASRAWQSIRSAKKNAIAADKPARVRMISRGRSKLPKLLRAA
jgi:hypothetical protein